MTDDTEMNEYNWYRFGRHEIQVDWGKEYNDPNDEDLSDTNEIGLNKIINTRMVG